MSERLKKPFEGIPAPIYFSSKTGEPLERRVLAEGYTPQGSPYRVTGSGFSLDRSQQLDENNTGLPPIKIVRGILAINKSLAPRRTT